MLLQTVVRGEQILAPKFHEREPVEEFGMYTLTTTIGQNDSFGSECNLRVTMVNDSERPIILYGLGRRLSCCSRVVLRIW